MDKKKIWIKANGNGEIATGHIRRCMTIASELIKNGAEVEFILSDEYSANVLITLSDALVPTSLSLEFVLRIVVMIRVSP